MSLDNTIECPGCKMDIEKQMILTTMILSLI